MLLVKLLFVNRRLAFEDEKCRSSAGKRQQAKMHGHMAHIKCGELAQENVQQEDFHSRSFVHYTTQCHP